MSGETLTFEETRKQNARLKRRASMKDDLALHIMAFPSCLGTFCFAYLPLYGILLGFKDLNVQRGILGSEWVGLKFFKSFVGSPDTWIIIRNTLGYNIIFLLLNLVLSVALAMILNELHSKTLAKVVQTLYILPYFLSMTTVALLMGNFLHPSHGVLTNLLKNITGVQPYFYSEPRWWPFFFVTIFLWKSVGYNAIIYLASITGISKEYYEAAMLDGATKWQQARFITLPQLRTMISILLIMSLGGIFGGDFGLFYTVPQLQYNAASLWKVSYTMDVYVYQMHAVLNQDGISIAAGLIQSVVGMFFMLGSNWIVTKIEPDNALF